MFVERMRRRAGGACFLAFALVLAGCGAVRDALGSGDEASDTVEEVTSEPVTETTAAPVFDAEVYCSLSHDADAINASFTAFDDPVQLEGFFTSLTGLLNEAVPPSAIEAEFATFRTAYVDLQTQLAAGGYSIETLQASPILSDANVNAAISAVDAHDLELCGPAPIAAAAPEADPAEEAASDNPFSEALASGDFTAVEELLNTEQGRAEFIEGFLRAAPGLSSEQAGCFLDNSDIPLLAEMSVDPADLSDEAVQGFIAALDACEIPLSAFQP